MTVSKQKEKKYNKKCVLKNRKIKKEKVTWMNNKKRTYHWSWINSMQNEEKNGTNKLPKYVLSKICRVKKDFSSKMICNKKDNLTFYRFKYKLVWNKF